MKPVNVLSPWDLSAQQAQAERLKASGDTRAQLEHAARGFETIMVRKWIELARKSSLDPQEGAMAGYASMVDDQLAFLISKQGGIGFAKPMVDQMMAQIKQRDWVTAEQRNTIMVETQQ